MHDDVFFEFFKAMNFVEINAAHLHPKGAISEYIHNHRQDDFFRCD